MNLRKANLGQLQYLSGYTDYRYEALLEIDRRVHDDK